MKRILCLLFVLILSISFISIPLIALSQEKSPVCEVYFSPRGGCTGANIKELDRATVSVLVQAYSFTSAPYCKGSFKCSQAGR